jgi:alpha-beta hydrolase superfamily lysophospholipase
MTAFTFYSKSDKFYLKSDNNGSKSDRIELYGKNWSVDDPKAVILIIPGFGDHCERYKHVTSFFNEHNMAVVGIDLRGQGHSNGERGYLPSIKAYFDDVTSGIEKVHEFYPDVPLFMYGDSIGAAILCMYTNQRHVDPLPFQALIACTPSVIFPKKPNFIHLAFVRAFAFLVPHARAPVAGAVYIYTNNQEAIDDRKSDPLFHDRWPGRTAAILCECGLYFERNICHFPIPTLIQHGSKAFLPIEEVREWVKKSTPQKNIKFKEWEGFYAELHNDLGRDELFKYTLSWIEEQLELLKNTKAS